MTRRKKGRKLGQARKYGEGVSGALGSGEQNKDCEREVEVEALLNYLDRRVVWKDWAGSG